MGFDGFIKSEVGRCIEVVDIIICVKRMYL